MKPLNAIYMQRRVNHNLQLLFSIVLKVNAVEAAVEGKCV